MKAFLATLLWVASFCWVAMYVCYGNDTYLVMNAIFLCSSAVIYVIPDKD